jgi:hypothetical protein
LQSLPKGEKFDTIIYIDVLEHIEHDVSELELAGSMLRSQGRVIVLSPAYQFLFTPFDAAVGHFRRYSRSSMRKLHPHGLELERLFSLDFYGIAMSMANRLLLRQSMPTKSQIRTWDKWIIPVSRVLDPVLRYSIGKSIVGIWLKP